VPKVLFHCIKDRTKIALLGKTPYTDKQLVLTASCLLFSTGLYIRTFKDWDQVNNHIQIWIELKHIIQEAFQHHLNATAPIAAHQGYAPALPYMQNAFGALAEEDNDDISADTSTH
jgi:hypothetical protein